MSYRKLAINLAACTAVVLVAMGIVGAITGAAQEPHEHVLAPEAYAIALLENAKGLRPLMALDVAFLILYTGLFAAFAGYLRQLGRPFMTLAFGLMLAVALLDIVEDHHILAMLESAEHHVLPSARAIELQTTISMSKFNVSYLSLFMFGLAIPRTTRLGWALCIFLTIGNLTSAVIGYALPPEQQIAMEPGRGIGFLIGLGLVIAWLWRSPEATSLTPAGEQT